jgi:hypothetical protein
MSGNLLEVHAADLLAVTSDLADARAAATHKKNKTTFRFDCRGWVPIPHEHAAEHLTAIT